MEPNNKYESLKKVLMPAGITLGVVLAIGLLLYLLAIPFDIYIIHKLHTYVVTKIVNITGLSQWLVKGLVIILLIPLLWVLPNIYMGKHKKPARAIGLLYFGIFFLALFFLSKDLYFAHSGNEILKWYALTPEGVKFYDSPGIDPVYGIKLKPVTPQVIRSLKLLQKGDFKPIDPSSAQFFNPITGETQVWFYKYPDRSYEFYDKPGYHPITGDSLKPVTKQIYFEWKDKEKAHKEKELELKQAEMEEKRKQQVLQPKPPLRVVIPDYAKKWKGAIFTITDKTNNETTDYEVMLNSTFKIPGSTLSLMAANFLPDFKMEGNILTSVSPALNEPAVYVAVFEKDNLIYNAWQFAKHPGIKPFKHERYKIIFKQGIE
jgi:hypothetical protein